MRIVEPSFFASDNQMIELARRLGVLADDETLEGRGEKADHLAQMHRHGLGGSATA